MKKEYKGWATFKSDKLRDVFTDKYTAYETKRANRLLGIKVNIRKCRIVIE